MRITNYPWRCNDISFTGESLIQNNEGTLIGEVYNSGDVKLICKAPEMYDLLQSCKVALIDLMNYGEVTDEEAQLFESIKELQKLKGH